MVALLMSRRRNVISTARHFDSREKAAVSWLVPHYGVAKLLDLMRDQVDDMAIILITAGLFVPCGKGSFPSVLVMIGTPAVVAGVREITVVVPPNAAIDESIPTQVTYTLPTGAAKQFCRLVVMP